MFRSGASAYVFVGPSDVSGIDSVTFSLDGTRFSVDRRAPFDFAGSSGAGAYPFESNLLSVGTHRVGARVVMRNGRTVTLSATFTVAGTTPHRLLVSPRRVAPQRGR